MTNKVLVLAAHPDDEALGCGGTLARLADEGSETAVLLFTDGVGARNPSTTDATFARRSALQSAMKVLGVQHFEGLNLPDNAMDSLPVIEVVRRIEEFCSHWGTPTDVFVHHPDDLNVDHRIVFNAAMTCFRPQPSANGLPGRILTYEVVSSTGWADGFGTRNFMPNVFMEITGTLPRKLDALRCYDEEMRAWPHARSIEAVEHLARHRGATVGLEAAEAFQLVRSVCRQPTKKAE